jgi:hypothetical protein
MNTGDDGKTSGGGIESVAILGTLDGTEVGGGGTISDETTGTPVGISEIGIDDGIIVVTDGAITIVFDVVNV